MCNCGHDIMTLWVENSVCISLQVVLRTRNRESIVDSGAVPVLILKQD